MERLLRSFGSMKSGRSLLASFLVLASVILTLYNGVWAESEQATDQVNSEHMNAQHVGHHYYASPADQAQDALLITEVKSALANHGPGNFYAITVDADHGTVILTGEVPNRAAAARIKQLAAACDGVTGVRANLDWPNK